jgi:KipI family sensor histidine kinase inhibitor
VLPLFGRGPEDRIEAVTTQLVPLGDRAWLARFPSETDARRWARAARETRRPGVVDVVLAYKSAAVHFDPDKADPDSLEAWLRDLSPSDEPAEPSRIIRLPVLYDGADLADVASKTGLTIEQVIARHSDPAYDVFAVGYQPGFPYAGYLRSPLDRIPRRPEPRLKVPAGSVAIAARQTGVFPSELPSGWNLLGRTPLSIVDVAAHRFPIRAGDWLKFDPIDAAQFAALRGKSLK